MSRITQLQCRCGAVGMEAEGAPIMSTECLCTSCRNAADVLESLPDAPRLREATGGTRTQMFRKDRVRCVRGAANLREFRLTEKTKTRRIVAVCCNTAMMLDFTDGHWVDLYGPLWPEGALPPLQMRTMTGDLDDASTLPDDVPNHRTHSAGFFIRLILAWAAMGFRRPKIDYVEGVLDVHD
jgi:hypothetical protein